MDEGEAAAGGEVLVAVEVVVGGVLSLAPAAGVLVSPLVLEVVSPP